MRLHGITRRGAVKRYLRRDLNAYNLVRRFVEFELGIDGLAAQAGDVIGISHDVPGYGFSGRIWETATVGTSIKLDRVIVLAAATSYQIQVENVASEVRETKPITSAAGTYQPGSAITIGGGGFSFLPEADDEYALGEVAKGEVKLFRIIETTLNPRELRRRVKCMEYNPDVYLDDFGTLPDVGTSTLSAPTVPAVPPGVENLSVQELTVKGPDGSIRIGGEVTFTHFPDTYSAVGSTEIYVSQGSNFGDAKLVATLAPSQVSVDLSGVNFERNISYTIWVQPKTRDGATSYRSWASFVTFTPSGLATTPKAPTNLQATINGEDAVYLWDDPGDLDFGAIVEARRGGWILGLRVFEVPAQARTTPPILDWAYADPNLFEVAAPDVNVRTKLGNGQYSAAIVVVPTLVVAGSGGVAHTSNEEDLNWT
jgi:hypothetical protein